LTWRHNSVLNYIAGCLKYALVGKSTVELYCDLERLQAPGGGSIPADVMVQAQKSDFVIIDRTVHGRHRIRRNVRPRDMQTSKLLSAMRGDFVSI
jgi:hypothetical protein